MQSEAKITEPITEKGLGDFYDFLEDKYGLHLRWYNQASLKRRLEKVLMEFRLRDLYSLMLLIVSDRKHYEKFLDHFTVNVTECFREPKSWLEIRESIIPFMQRQQNLSVLIVGGSTGEELVSLAILLEETKLLNRARIVCSDLSEAALEQARRPIIPRAKIMDAIKNYELSGGQKELEMYYQSTATSCHFHSYLFENVEYRHFDITQSELGEQFDLIICRNLLIYFQTQHQHHPLARLVRHLKPGGFLNIGEQESLSFYRGPGNLQIVSASQKIYRQDLIPSY